jgi:hypothetical protein
MIEEDYEWLTEQIVKVANSCCNGRVVSALEGGYKIHGGIISPFARSVASHVRALVDGGNSREEYNMDEGEWESRFERHMNEEKEKKRQMKMDRHYRSTEGITPDNDLNLGDIGEIRNKDDEDHLGLSRKRSRKQVDYKQLFEQMKKEGI